MNDLMSKKDPNEWQVSSFVCEFFNLRILWKNEVLTFGHNLTLFRCDPILSLKQMEFLTLE